MAYTPFWNPLPVWQYWYLMLIPLSLGISIVYKSVKCHSMKSVPREAGVIFMTIIIGMVLAAVALVGIVRLLEQR